MNDNDAAYVYTAIRSRVAASTENGRPKDS